MGDPVTAVTAAIGLGMSFLTEQKQSKASAKATAAAKAASDAEQAYNEKVLTEQRNAALLENQANLNTTQTEVGGSAAASEDAGYSGSEIRRRKRNANTISGTLGL